MKFFKIVFSGIFLFTSAYLNAQTYCTPSFSNGCQFNNNLSQVSVGGMTNNTSGCTVSNYTNISPQPSVVAGDTTSMSVTVAGWDGIAVYIDLNNDGDLSDTNEFIYSRYIAVYGSTYNFNFVLPANTTPGNHRLRVNCGNGGSVGGGNPCVSTSYGNFHDYTLAITNNCQKDSNLAVSNVTSTSADFTWAPRNGGAYEYVLDTNSADPTGSGTVTTSTSFSANSLTTGLHYYFHIRTSCGQGIYSAWGKVDFVACDLPDAQINQSGNIKLCRGDTLTLSVPFSASNTYQWYRNSTVMPGQTSNTTDIFLFPAKYYCKVSEYPGCESNSDIATVSIHDKPAAPFLTVNGNLLSTAGFPTYEWYVDGNLIPGVINSNHTATVNGFYHVVGIDTNSCSASSDTLEVTTVGIEKYGLAVFDVFPNPTSSIVFIKGIKEGIYLIQVQNMLGEIVFSQRENLSENTPLNLTALPKGLYVLSIKNDKVLGSQRLLLD